MFMHIMVSVALLIIVLIGYTWISYEHIKFRSESESIREEYIEAQKAIIRFEVKNVVDYIHYNQSRTHEKLKETIQNRTLEACAIAMNIYMENQGSKDISEIKKMVRDALRPIRYNGGRGYYFATGLDGVNELLADLPELEGKNLLDMQDTQGKYVIRDMIAIARDPGEGFYEYTWTKPGSREKSSPKIAYVKYFEPFDWYIGTGEYLDDVEKDIQAETLKRIEKIRFGKDGYIFVGQWDGLSLSEPARGKNMYQLKDINGVKIVQELIRAAQAGGGFVTYMMPGFQNRKPFMKISYARGIEAWQWYIGAGISLEEANAAAIRKRDDLKIRVKEHIITFGIILIALLITIYFMAQWISMRIQKELSAFSAFFERAATQSVKIDPDSLTYTEFRNIALSANQMIEERGRAEETLRFERSRLFSVLEAIPAFVYLRGKDYVIRFSNRRFKEIFGESEGKYCYQVIEHRTLPCEICQTPGTIGFPERRQWEWIDSHSGKTYIIYAKLLPDADGSVGMLEMGIDITDRKQMEEDLRRLRNMLRNVIDSMPSIVIGVAADGRITHWNREAEKAAGVAADQAEGRLLADVFPRLEPEMEKVEKAIRSKHPVKQERFPWEYQGEIRFASVTVYPLITDSQSDLGGAVIRIDDVTERVRIQEIMIQTEKMMSVGGLAAGMAHEINNPLGGIIQSIQNILRRISPDLPDNQIEAGDCGTSLDAVREYLKRRKIIRFLEGIRESGERAAEIVSNMLSFSRPGESRMTHVNIPDLIENTVELAAHDYDLKKKYDFRRIEIIRDFSPDIPQIPCIATEIEQVLLNLLRNAAQAMMGQTETQPRIVLRLRIEAHHIRIEVEDNGPGMAEAIRKRAFEPFFTTKEVGIGTGLGLSVSYFIITRNHKGIMDAESFPGKGAKFIVRLPLTVV
jgi:PAS domain S-box-containing protein